MTFDVQQSDAVQWANEYDGPLFHALLCDPPYHLTSGNISVDWATFAGISKGDTNHDGRGHKRTGFMGKVWDGGAVAFQPETWAAFMKVLHPGAFCFAFGGSRTSHRMACAIEDAGFILNTSVFLWAFGSGFPKATRVHSTPFEGHRYGLQALKPAVEVCLLFQKPYAKGRTVDSITATGAGALNIDAARIGTPGFKWDEPRGGIWSPSDGTHGAAKGGDNPDGGRWPANFALVHSPLCNGECVPDCPVRLLDEQSGESVSNGGHGHAITGMLLGEHIVNGVHAGGLGDTGGASRFFLNADWNEETAAALDEAAPVFYHSKAGKAERDAGLDSQQDRTRNRVNPGGIEHDPKWAPVIRKNHHPTVKPISLTRWLATLLLPPDVYAPRCLFVPFCGSGSEMCGAVQAGWECVHGVEMEADYCEIARARVEYHRMQRYTVERREPLQADLFAMVRE